MQEAVYLLNGAVSEKYFEHVISFSERIDAPDVRCWLMLTQRDRPQYTERDHDCICLIQIFSVNVCTVMVVSDRRLYDTFTIPCWIIEVPLISRPAAWLPERRDHSHCGAQALPCLAFILHMQQLTCSFRYPSFSVSEIDSAHGMQLQTCNRARVRGRGDTL